MGPVMLDVSGYELQPDEKEMLDHPSTGGLILFTRNYHDQQQLSHLIEQIRDSARNQLIIAVDHEGGRVQRFRQGFSVIPAMGDLLPGTDGDLVAAQQYADQFGWLLAAELLAFDIDISFTPVLDICGISEVIKDRSFHADPVIISQLAASLVKGMHRAGMKSTGKHFPGHGNVKEDSHIAIPIDRRSRQSILEQDMQPFILMNQQGLLDAVMPAHVIYPEVDDKPAGFSSVWIEQILRAQLGFDGVVFSDDLSMQGAVQMGSFAQRAQSALTAGCDMVLVCNDPAGAAQVLDYLPVNAQSNQRLSSLLKGPSVNFAQLKKSADYLQALRTLDRFHAS